MKKIVFLLVVALFMLSGICIADVIILDDGSVFEGEFIGNATISDGRLIGKKFRVESGQVTIYDKNWKIISIEKREPTEEEKKKMFSFKGEDYDVTFNDKRSYSSPLTPFEEKVDERIDVISDTYPNLSDYECLEMVAQEFNLPAIVIDYIDLKVHVKR